MGIHRNIRLGKLDFPPLPRPVERNHISTSVITIWLDILNRVWTRLFIPRTSL